MPDFTEGNTRQGLALQNPGEWFKAQAVQLGADVADKARVIVTNTLAAAIMLMAGYLLDLLLAFLTKGLRDKYPGFQWTLEHIQIMFFVVVTVYFSIDTIRNLMKLSSESTSNRQGGGNR